MIQEVVEQLENTTRDIMTSNLHTSMPATIEAIHEDTGLVDLKPCGSYYVNGVEMEYPLIPSVPLVINAGANGGIVTPIKVGDSVMMSCAEQSISSWLTETMKDQMDERFELQNAMAVPGLQKQALEKQVQANAEDAVFLYYGESAIKVSAEGVEISQGEATIILSGGSVTISGGTCTINGDANVNGNLNVSGNITCGGDFPCKGGSES